MPPLAESAKGTHPEPVAAISFQTWRFLTDKDNSVVTSDQWAQPSFNDGNWRSIGNEAWNLAYGDLRNYGGIGLYRSQPFDIPPVWAGKQITLNAYGLMRWMGFGFNHAEVFINGARIDAFPNPYRQAGIADRLKEKGNVLCIRLNGRGPVGDFPLSGLLDCAIWIEPKIQLHSLMSLAGEWQAVSGGWSAHRTVTLPGKTTGNHFYGDVDIPAEWQGESIFVHIRSSPGTSGVGMQNGVIMINGRPVSMFPVFYSSCSPEDTMNLTPYLKYGQRNRIELWPKLEQRDPARNYDFSIEAIELGCGTE